MRLHAQGRRHGQHLGFAPGSSGLLQLRQAGRRAQVGATRVDAVHQVEALHGRGFGAGHADGAGVVDQDVDTSKGFHRLGHRRKHGIIVAYVHRQRQRLATRRFNLGRRAVDGAGQLGIRVGGLGQDDDVGAVPRRAFGNGQANTTRGTGDEQGLALERGCRCSTGVHIACLLVVQQNNATIFIAI